MYRLFLMCCITGALAGINLGAQTKYPYLVAAANRLIEVNAQGSRATPADLAAAGKQACSALEQLLKDTTFRAELGAWVKPAQSTDRTAFKRDLGLFIEAFLTPERTILEKAGFTRYSAEQMLLAAATVQSSIDAQVSEEMILASLGRLRTDVCTLSVKVEAMAQRAEQDLVRRRWVVGLMGAGLIIADVAVAGPVGAASGVAGMFLIERAVPGLELK